VYLTFAYRSVIGGTAKDFECTSKLKAGKCSVGPRAWNKNCKRCRLDACLSAGMKAEKVASRRTRSPSDSILVGAATVKSSH